MNNIDNYSTRFLRILIFFLVENIPDFSKSSQVQYFNIKSVFRLHCASMFDLAAYSSYAKAVTKKILYISME